MEKRKILGITIASLGLVVSVGTAVALYKTNAQDAGFGISQGTYEGAGGLITYKINDATSGTIAPQYWNHDGSDKTGHGLSPVFDQVVYEGTLSATFSNSLNAQNFVVGNLEVKVENIPAEYQGKLSIWVDVDGYEANSLGAHYYATLLENDYNITNENTSFTTNKDIAVSASGVQKVRVFLKYDVSELNLLTRNEASLGYTVSIKWAAQSQAFGNVYVVGNGNQWEFDDAYAMVPNINKAHAEGWEWVYNNLPGSFEQAKCAKPGEGDTKLYSHGEDAVLEANKTYDVYWNGDADENEHVGTAASFSEQA